MDEKKSMTDDEYQEFVNKQYEEPKEEPSKTPFTVISNNSFVGVQFDPSTIETVHVVARALLNITEVFKAQNVHIDAMIKVNQENESLNKS